LMLSHIYLRKVDCSSFVMCLLLALALPRVFLQQQLTVLTRQTRQAVFTNKQSNLKKMMPMCSPHQSRNKQPISR
jgi:hypothetical protein